VALDQVLASIDVERWLAELGGDVDRAENVEELRSHAEQYDRLSPGGGLRGFLQEVALVSEVDALADDDDRVVLMTLHSAKGLEFDHVFLAGVEEELLPHARSIAEGDEEGGGVEEERRLFYVGMTRARQRLFLTHARTRQAFGAQRWSSASRFLAEIPPEWIEGELSSEEAAEVLGEFAPSPAIPTLRVGDRVRHEQFGTGRVQALVGSGVNARATVEFTHHGTRQLLLVYAKLERLGGRDG
jgi:DNA helicase-2/ATP-dependent DNA helicase PcrA